MAKLNKVSIGYSPKWAELPLVLNFKQARTVLGLGVTAMYTLTDEPGFPGRKHGGIWLIDRDNLRMWIASGAGDAPKRKAKPAPTLPPYQRRTAPIQ